ncbi:aminotransferase [Thelonectria olida]|uniref:Aminotransferase n=1 Tax=Thelonectria olida TaxID=1576542 RepID=A0A9P9AM96_9HYPO|nr:aminotransferase [Thelonectria olida]
MGDINFTSLAPLDASRLELNLITSPKNVPPPDSPDVLAIKAATDHMILAQWSAQGGWEAPKVVPYGPIPLLPSASALQYATQCFEGMKVFRGHDGQLRLFRPDYNCERFFNSATRIALPGFDKSELLKLIRKICALEAPKWLPKDQTGSALYIRPTFIGSDSSLGFKVPEEALLCIFLTYWPAQKPLTANDGPAACRLLASNESVVRAFPGGTGAAKIGANYGPSLLEHAEAKSKGYDQVLWLFGPDRQITEAGSTNVFVIWRTLSGSLQIVTPPLDGDKLILAGGTRRSLIELAREMFKVGKEGAESCEVLEERITLPEVEKAAQEGRLEGVFVVGTAFQIQSVRQIGFNGKDVDIAVEKTCHVSMLRERLANIVYGNEDSTWTQIVDEEAI